MNSCPQWVESGQMGVYPEAMRSWAIWYRTLFIAWAFLGLPSLVIGYGFSGGDFELPSDFASAVSWSAAVFLLLSPALLWPWRREGRKEGFD